MGCGGSSLAGEKDLSREEGAPEVNFCNVEGITPSGAVQKYAAQAGEDIRDAKNKSIGKVFCLQRGGKRSRVDNDGQVNILDATGTKIVGHWVTKESGGSILYSATPYKAGQAAEEGLTCYKGEDDTCPTKIDPVPLYPWMMIDGGCKRKSSAEGKPYKVFMTNGSGGFEDAPCYTVENCGGAFCKFLKGAGGEGAKVLAYVGPGRSELPDILDPSGMCATAVAPNVDPMPIFCIVMLKNCNVLGPADKEILG